MDVENVPTQWTVNENLPAAQIYDMSTTIVPDLKLKDENEVIANQECGVIPLMDLKFEPVVFPLKTEPDDVVLPMCESGNDPVINEPDAMLEIGESREVIISDATDGGVTPLMDVQLGLRSAMQLCDTNLSGLLGNCSGEPPLTRHAMNSNKNPLFDDPHVSSQISKSDDEPFRDEPDKMLSVNDSGSIEAMDAESKPGPTGVVALMDLKCEPCRIPVVPEYGIPHPQISEYDVSETATYDNTQRTTYDAPPETKYDSPRVAEYDVSHNYAVLPDMNSDEIPSIKDASGVIPLMDLRFKSNW